MRKPAIDAENFWCDNCIDIGYALGETIMMFILFEREREKEMDSLWEKRVEPFGGDEFKMKFIEDGDEYAFVMYRESPENGLIVGPRRKKLEANERYENFKMSLQDEFLFTYGFSTGERFRLAERYKIIRDIEFLRRSEIKEGTFLLELLDLEKEDK
jgi:hypothetical protein